VDNHLYKSVEDLRAEIADGKGDPHLRVAARLFARPASEVTRDEHWWGRLMNIMTAAGMDAEKIARDFRLNPEIVKAMTERYHDTVLAA
jgi:DNA polymerase I-like protein with 3'-5' exonuclease and polymerase domains